MAVSVPSIRYNYYYFFTNIPYTPPTTAFEVMVLSASGDTMRLTASGDTMTLLASGDTMRTKAGIG